MFVAKITLSGLIVNVCQEAHVSLVPPHHSCQVTPGPYSNVNMFQSQCLGFEVLGYALSMWPHCPIKQTFFWAKLSNRLGEEKKLSIYSLWPNSSTPFVRLVTVA